MQIIPMKFVEEIEGKTKHLPIQSQNRTNHGRNYGYTFRVMPKTQNATRQCEFGFSKMDY